MSEHTRPGARTVLGVIRSRRATGEFVALLAAVALVGAGCVTTSASPGVARAAAGTTTTSIANFAGTSGSPARLESEQLRYTACMQHHGEPDYPEPGDNATAAPKAIEKLDPSSPTFEAAVRSCRGIMTTGGTFSPAERANVEREALKFASCMRSHGMTNWPDPDGEGGYMVGLAGKAADSPTYLKAARICKPLLPGG